VGAEFQVNSYTTGCQGTHHAVDAASDPDGNVTVVWSSFPCFGRPSQDGSDSGVYAQRYDAFGLRRGSEFRVNTYTTSDQGFPSVASNAAGDFVVVWTSLDQNRPGHGVFGQRFDRSGEPVGGEFQVDVAPVVNLHPSVASDAAGNFVVAWTSYTPEFRPVSVVARRFAASGAPVGSEFRVDTATTAELVSGGDVAMRADGRFVVSWTVASDLGWGSRVRVRRFDSAGVPQGDELNLCSFLRTCHEPSVTMDSGGAFVVAWSEHYSSPWEFNVAAARYDAAGAPRGTIFPVGGFPRWSPSAAADSSGNLIVAYSTAEVMSVYAERFGGLVPGPAVVDAAPSGGSNGNRVLEPGESVDFAPSWRNVNGSALTFAGRGVAFTGPAAAGVGYALLDDAADYGTVANGSQAPCSDCYSVGVTSEGQRPSTHWDALLTEQVTPDALGQTSIRPLHVGGSFADVPKTAPSYRFVETVLHQGLTAGCRSGEYCPGDPITREQMAVFSLLGRYGAAYLPPPCAVPVFGDVPAASPYCRFIEDLSRRGIASGCGDGNYCPGATVTREQAAVFLLRTLDAALQPPACAAPNMFTDVAEDSPFCRWIEELVRRGIASGCGDGKFCPRSPTTREQMAVLTTQTFGMTLY
jgi:hypothetical protein